jgi:UTP--glucose-1-phosphate uridylyltransferase
VGLGTRFLSATKAMLKEMLPIVDKPTIQYNVEEAVESELRILLLLREKVKERLKAILTIP